MVIVMCQTGNGGIFSVDGWSIFCSCALVAGSGCVRACSGESRHSAMVSLNLYTNQQFDAPIGLTI